MVKWGHIIYGGVNSADYGIYITGEAVYNAPERDVEFIEVPGRNGSIALDNGRYRNITVTYPAGCYGGNQKEFREKMTAFRNAILSQRGYQRLEDTYHPDEYREGIYTSGLEVSPVAHGRAGEFEIAFECKPQRWLTAGAYPIPVDSGDVIQNLTPFDSGPLLALEGYGDVSFNGYTVSLVDAVMGETEIVAKDVEEYPGSMAKTYWWDESLFNVGDNIYIGPVVFTFYITSDTAMYTGVSYTVDGISTVTPAVKVPAYTQNAQGNSLVTTITIPKITQAALSDTDSEVTKVARVNVSATKAGGGSDTLVLDAVIKINFTRVRLEMIATKTGTPIFRHFVWNLPPVTVNSSVNMLGNPTYIDCDLGEAYRIVNGEYQSLNKYVSLGSDLPTLAPGTNKVTFSNTYTDVKITPRWWRV